MPIRGKGARIRNSPRKFFNALEKELIDIVNQDTNAFVRMVIIRALRLIADRTPVDTGRAQSSWIVSIDRIDETVQPKGLEEYPPLEATVLDGSTEVGRFSIATNEHVFIANSLPYIIPLENGHSDRGRDMVRLTEQDIINWASTHPFVKRVVR